MIKTVDVKSSHLALNFGLHFKINLFEKPRGIDLGLPLVLDDLRLQTAKEAGGLDFRHRKSSSLPLSDSTHWIDNNDIALLVDGNAHRRTSLRLTAGRRTDDSLKFQVADGFGGGPMLVSINGDEAHVQSRVAPGTIIGGSRNYGTLRLDIIV